MDPQSGPRARRGPAIAGALLLTLTLPLAAVAQDDTSTLTSDDTEASAPAAAVPGGLEPTAHPKGGAGLQVFDIIEGGPGYIAVGGGTPTGLDHRALVWLSDDGRRWRAQPLFGDAAIGTMRAVAPLPDNGYVAVGNDFEPETERPDLVHALVWYSADGYGWERVPAHESFPGSMMWDVVGTPDGVVATGCQADFHCNIGRVWSSTDGFDWELTDGLAIAPYDITADRDGDLVISGEDDGVDLVNGRASAAARAEDWVVRSFATPDSQVQSGAAYGDGFLLASTLLDVASGDIEGSALQVSPDGVDWEILQPTALMGIYAVDVDAADDLVVLVGRDFRQKRSKPYLAWTRDLETYTPIPLPKKLDVAEFEGGAVRLTDDGARLFVLGAQAGRPAIWVSELR